jgi:hypothetical protein
MNYNKIKSFEQRYIKAMNEAFEKVKSEFQAEFETLVKDNLADDVYICSGMGSTSFYKFDESGRDEEIENKTTEVINNLEWGLNGEFSFRLSLPYKMTSKKVLTREVEEIIEDLYKSKGGTYKAIKDGYVSPHLAHIRYFKGWEVNENIIK